MSDKKENGRLLLCVLEKKTVEQKQNSALYENAESGATLKTKHYPPFNSSVTLLKEDTKEQ